MFAYRPETQVMGCGENGMDEESGLAYPNIRLLLASSAQNVEITQVILTISGPDMETQQEIMEIDGREATALVTVPAGENRRFRVQAFSDNGVEYEGEKIVEFLEAGSEVSLDIKLELVQISIKIIPSEIEVSLEDNAFWIDVNLSGIKDLFGCSFELEYDPAVLNPLVEDIVPRDFLGTGSDILFLAHVDPGIVSIGLTRKAGSGGVNGSGTIARVKFEVMVAGQTEIVIARSDDFALHKEDGTDVDRFGYLVIQDANVIIR